jgi:hypothetical protein
LSESERILAREYSHTLAPLAFTIVTSDLGKIKSTSFHHSKVSFSENSQHFGPSEGLGSVRILALFLFFVRILTHFIRLTS